MNFLPLRFTTQKHVKLEKGNYRNYNIDTALIGHTRNREFTASH